jgi:hypothetical protein
MESYAHNAAKKVFASWMREEAAKDNYPTADWWKWAGLTAKGTEFGIMEEYPICENYSGDGPHGVVWGESTWWEDYVAATGHAGDYPCRPPTYEECVAIGKPPRVILDLAVQHKGVISFAVEIVHKHDVSDEKRRFLEGAYFSTLVVSATWVLGQVRRPDHIVYRDVIEGPQKYSSLEREIVEAGARRERSNVVAVQPPKYVSDFSAGYRVRHQKFGTGTVLDTWYNRVTVRFDCGTRKIICDSFLKPAGLLGSARA